MSEENLKKYLYSKNSLSDQPNLILKVGDKSFAKSIINSGYYDGRIYIANTLDDYIDFLKELLLSFHLDRNGAEKRNSYVFRGISKIEQMKPTLLRTDYGALKNFLEDKKVEFEYIYKFEQNGCMKLGQFNNPIDLVAAAQHYGIRSRLLDWSTSPLVATLFAIYDDENAENDYYGLLFASDHEKGPRVKYLPCKTKDLKDLKNLDFPTLIKNANHSMTYSYRDMINGFEKLTSNRRELNKDSIDMITKSNLITESDYDNFKAKLEDLKNSSQHNLISDILSYFNEIVKNTNACIYQNDNNVNKELENKAIDLLKRFVKTDSSLLLETNFSNERLRNQRGILELVDTFMDDDIESFIKEGKNVEDKEIIDKIDDYFINRVSKNNKILLISKKARNEIIKYINKLGINYYTLIDDPDNCCRVINKTINKSISFDDKIDLDSFI